MAVYTLTSPTLIESLRSAALRGVEVRILLEGGPVGGVDEREWAGLGILTAAGGDVRLLADDPANGTLARYRFLHAKYAVVDGRVVVAGSENWGEHGFPPARTTGNRGWQLAVEDPGLAAYIEELFAGDFDPRRRDSRPFRETDPYLFASNETPSTGLYPRPIPSARHTGRFSVTPVIAPEHAIREDALLGVLGSAARSIDIEAFYVSRDWVARPNPYLEAAIAAARRGVEVRLLLDGTWYNVEGDDPVDNDDTAAYVNGLARKESLHLQAKIADAGPHGLAKLHNKGVLVDGRIAFVSSLNWNRNAATNNREVGLLVDGPEVVEPFRLAFEADWSDGGTAPGVPDTPDLLMNPLALPLLTLFVVNVALLASWARRRRRRGKGLSEGDPSE